MKAETTVQQQLNNLLLKIDEDVRTLEIAAYSQDYTQLELGLELLDKLLTASIVGPYTGLMQSEIEQVQVIATRIASATLAILLNPSFEPSYGVIANLLIKRRSLYNLFEISAYQGTTHAKQILIWRNSSNGRPSVTGINSITKALVLSSLDDIFSEFLQYLVSAPNEIRALMAVSLLSERMVLTPQGDANRNWLLAQDKLYDAIQPHIVFAPLISGVWMFCSYATATNKHDIKKSLNRWFKRLIDVKGFKPISTKQSQPEEHNFTKKPVAVVAIDVFRSTHAMFRWYSPIIRELKKDYQLVLVSRPDDVDNTSISLFDRFVPVSNDVESLQEVLDSCSPDLVYYPSIGMRPWAIALANLRWAPLQIMTLGHPATSHIDTIDAVILDSDLYTKSTVFSENQLILATKGGTLADNLIDLNLEELQGDRRTAKTNSLRIAIPCISMKINSEFIRALKAIKQQSPINIQYTFFPNEAGLTYMAIKKRLLLNFPNATIEQRVTYFEYMKMLNSHDIALSPFPFGNASSLADCLILGIPTVVLDGDEPHSRTDRCVYNAANIDTKLIGQSVDEYINAAVALIDSTIFRTAEREKIQQAAIYDIYKNNDKPFAMEFCKALRWAQANVDLLAKARGKVYYAKDCWGKE